MKNPLFTLVILCILWICHLSYGKKYYQRFTHAKSGRILQAYGHATYADDTDQQLFYADNYFKEKYLILEWYLESFKLLPALGIVGGCAQKATVKTLRKEHGPDQDWYIDQDAGTIANGCNRSWLLTLNNYGDQYVQDQDKIPKGDEKWNIEWRVSESDTYWK